MAKTQRSVKTVLHTTSETTLDYGMKKARLDMNMIQGAKIIYGGVDVHCVSDHDNLCKIMLDSKSREITQIIHTNLIGLFCDEGYARPDYGVAQNVFSRLRMSATGAPLCYVRLHLVPKSCLRAVLLT